MRDDARVLVKAEAVKAAEDISRYGRWRAYPPAFLGAVLHEHLRLVSASIWLRRVSYEPGPDCKPLHRLVPPAIPDCAPC